MGTPRRTSPDSPPERSSLTTATMSAGNVQSAMKMLQRVRELSAQVDEMTEALEETEDELAASQGAAGGDAAPDAAAVSLELRTKLAASEARVKDLEAKVKEQDAQLADAASSSAG